MKNFEKFIRRHMVNLLYLPALVMFAIFVLYPFLKGVRISFTDWNGFSQSFNYVGLRNYTELFQDVNVRKAFLNTLIYGFGSTLLQQCFGLAYAVLLNQSFAMRKFARTVIYMPVMIAGVIMGYMTYFLLQYNNGALNDLIGLFGMAPVDWLAAGNRAVLLIIAINSLQFVGISMVIYLAGLQNIPKSFYEASDIDGAGKINQFFHITLPLLKPAIITSVTINLIGGLKLFDQIKALTNGGPGYESHSMSTLIDATYFRSQQAGYSAAMGIVLFLFILVVSLVMLRMFDKRRFEY
ncbi:MAG: sugar ABC transporter permease [Planctomycetaceae bacterium]|nr:sugar ABC transporter permease [Planctomycetaceae bacterium]